MCGFFVYFSKKKKFFDKKKFLRSADLISHRGPDDNHTYFGKSIAMKFYRLSIRDVSDSGKQPMLSWSKRYLITFNGEIYNTKKLISYLDTKKLKSTSDTEILLNLIEKYGIKILSKIEGMFSFVIYDKINNKCILVRDRFGIKPLYYFENKDYFLFSSEIKPIINYNEKVNFDNKGFADFFLKQNMDHEGQTFFQNIKSVKPANYILITEKKIIQKEYWDLVKEEEKISFDDAKKKYFNLLEDSVSKHLISDRNIGLNFSGGTDSTILATLMRSKINYPLKTYTYDFENNNNSEANLVKKLTKKLNLKNSLSLLNSKSVIDEIDKLCYSLESPFTSIRLIGVKKNYEKMKNDNIVVAFDGTGGDEILGGYEYNQLYFNLDLLDKNKKDFYKKIYNFFIKNKKKNKLINYLVTSTNLSGSLKDCTPFVHINNFRKEFLNKFVTEDYYNYKLSKKLNFLKKSQFLDIKFINLTRSLKYNDRLAMISGVENRVPFLDHKIAEFCFNLPNHLKIKDEETRYLSKIAMKSYLPRKFFSKKKVIITDPQITWLKTNMRDYIMDNFNSKKFRENEMYDYKNIIKEYNSFLKYGKRTSFDLFQIITSFRFQEVYKSKFKVTKTNFN
tara:strand:+ start:332 stop:2188 length:1857 start_codon:yes stop_codon:yes gene_type:complete